MRKYTFVFAASYLLLAGVLAAVAELLKFKGGAGLGIATILGASFIASWMFTKDHGREPTKEEKLTYSLQAVVSVWIVSLLVALLLFALFSSPGETKAIVKVMATKSFLLIFAGGAVVLSLICYAAVRWSFAWYAKLALKNSHAA